MSRKAGAILCLLAANACGEGTFARENFRLASASEREALLKFLESL
jgi:CxxC motif-containing protein (DUF1111 family)